MCVFAFPPWMGKNSMKLYNNNFLYFTASQNFTGQMKILKKYCIIENYIGKIEDKFEWYMKLCFVIQIRINSYCLVHPMKWLSRYNQVASHESQFLNVPHKQCCPGFSAIWWFGFIVNSLWTRWHNAEWLRSLSNYFWQTLSSPCLTKFVKS